MRPRPKYIRPLPRGLEGGNTPKAKRVGFADALVEFFDEPDLLDFGFGGCDNDDEDFLLPIDLVVLPSKCCMQSEKHEEDSRGLIQTQELIGAPEAIGASLLAGLQAQL
jgi:hypothetical protein